jgi:hypothetical protein
VQTRSAPATTSRKSGVPIVTANGVSTRKLKASVLLPVPFPFALADGGVVMRTV